MDVCFFWLAGTEKHYPLFLMKCFFPQKIEVYRLLKRNCACQQYYFSPTNRRDDKHDDRWSLKFASRATKKICLVHYVSLVSLKYCNHPGLWLAKSECRSCFFSFTLLQPEGLGFRNPAVTTERMFFKDDFHACKWWEFSANIQLAQSFGHQQDINSLLKFSTSFKNPSFFEHG